MLALACGSATSAFFGRCSLCDWARALFWSRQLSVAQLRLSDPASASLLHHHFLATDLCFHHLLQKTPFPLRSSHAQRHLRIRCCWGFERNDPATHLKQTGTSLQLASASGLRSRRLSAFPIPDAFFVGVSPLSLINSPLLLLEPRLVQQRLPNSIAASSTFEDPGALRPGSLAT